MIWRLLAVAETGNICDWWTTMIGVAGLHLHERNPMAAVLIRAMGAPWGITLFKAAVAFELAGMAGAALWLASRRGGRGGVVCAIGLAGAGALLWLVSVVNLDTLTQAMHMVTR